MAGWQKRIQGTWVDQTTKREVTVEALGGKVWLWPHRGGMRVELKQVGDELIVDDRLGFGARIKWIDGHPKAGDNDWTRKEVEVPPAARRTNTNPCSGGIGTVFDGALVPVRSHCVPSLKYVFQVAPVPTWI